MQTAFFAFDVDAERDLVRITLSGFFDEQDIAAFQSARVAEYRALRCGQNQHLTLVDIREMQIQAQESVARFQQVLADPRMAARKIAFVVSKSLARLQAQRAADGLAAHYFTTLAEAEAWLLGDDTASGGAEAGLRAG